MAREKFAVVQALAGQCVCDPEHQRDIGAGADRVPYRADFRRQVVAQRADQVELGAARRRRPQPVAHDMPAHPADADIIVFERHAAERQQHFGVARHLVPADAVAGNRLLRRHHMRQDHARRAGAVAVDRADIAAGHVQKAVDLALRVVKAAGAGPAIGAAEHHARAMLAIDPAQFRGGDVERLVPRHRDEFAVAAAPAVRPGTALQPAAADRRPCDARLVRQRRRQVAEQLRRRRVARMRHDLDLVATAAHRKRPPMCTVRYGGNVVRQKGIHFLGLALSSADQVVAMR